MFSVKRVQLKKTPDVDDEEIDNSPFVDWDGVTKLDDRKFLDDTERNFDVATRRVGSSDKFSAQKLIFGGVPLEKDDFTSDD